MSYMNASLEVTSRKKDDKFVIEAVGELDLTTIKLLEQPLSDGVQATLDTAAITALSLDLRRLNFIDSAGLALLVAARKRLAPAKRTLEIMLTQGRQPDRVLRAGRFDTIMALCYGDRE